MWKTIERTIEEYQMLREGDRVIAGVSGGADSVCLLRVLHNLCEKKQLSLTVVHIEHGIRGLEALEDARFVDSLCKQLKVPLKIFHFDVPKLASLWGMTEEEAGRKVRYDCFADLAGEDARTKIAVAHNANDVAETLIFNLVRGTGIQGMAGIPPVRDNIIRPLIHVTRTEIEEYLASINQDYRTDRTNLETEYARNKIRHKILPVLEEINPEAVSHMMQAAGRIWDMSQVMQREGMIRYPQYCSQEPESIFLLEALMHKELPLWQEWIIKKAISTAAGSEKDIATVHVELVKQLMENQPGRKCDLPYGLEAVKEYNGVRIRKRALRADLTPIMEEVKLLIPGDTVINRGEMVIRTSIQAYSPGDDIPEKKYTKWFDYDIIKDNLRVRTRQSGDYLVVNSEGGTKKLKNYLIEEKVPREQRDQIPLLTCEHHIIWIIGMRMDESVKVTANTRKILEIQINGGQGNERNN